MNHTRYDTSAEGARIYLAVQPINLRKSFDGLAVLTQSVIAQNPLLANWDRFPYCINSKNLTMFSLRFFLQTPYLY